MAVLVVFSDFCILTSSSVSSVSSSFSYFQLYILPSRCTWHIISPNSTISMMAVLVVFSDFFTYSLFLLLFLLFLLRFSYFQLYTLAPRLMYVVQNFIHPHYIDDLRYSQIDVCDLCFHLHNYYIIDGCSSSVFRFFLTHIFFFLLPTFFFLCILARKSEISLIAPPRSM